MDFGDNWKEFLTLKELADEWGNSEEDIIHLAIIGKLRLSVYWTGGYCVKEGNRVVSRTANTPLNQYVFIGACDAKDFLTGYSLEKYGAVEPKGTYLEDGRKVILVRNPCPMLDQDYEKIEYPEHTLFPASFSRKNILVTQKELTRFKKENPNWRSNAEKKEFHILWQRGLDMIRNRHQKNDCFETSNPPPEEEPIPGWTKIKAAFGIGWSRNTIITWAKKAEIEITKNKPTLTPAEIIKIKARRGKKR